MLDMGASDLHLTAGAPPTVRVDGSLRPIPDAAPLTPEVIMRVMYSIVTQQQRETFEETLELDFSYALPGEARFRVNLYQQRDSIGAAFRVIPYEIKPHRGAGHARRSVGELRRAAARTRARDRAHRLGQVHHPRRDDRPGQPDRARTTS